MTLRRVNHWLKRATSLAAVAASLGAGALGDDESRPLTITSTAFADHGAIPGEYTCDGQDASPPLSWSGVPDRARSLALIVDDPDAPGTTWVHWVLYNLPSESGGLGAGVTRAALPRGSREGRNDWRRTGYGGPCPPSGRHRYFFKLYALDIELPDLGQPSKAQLHSAMQGHIVADATLVGTYRRAR